MDLIRHIVYNIYFFCRDILLEIGSLWGNSEIGWFIVAVFFFSVITQFLGLSTSPSFMSFDSDPLEDDPNSPITQDLSNPGDHIFNNHDDD